MPLNEKDFINYLNEMKSFENAKWGGEAEVVALAKILKVDAVIKCSYAYEKTGSEGGAIAKAILLGGGGKTGSGSLVMQINQGNSGELMWRFYKEMNESFTSSANEVMERMMRKVSRNFPYEKD